MHQENLFLIKLRIGKNYLSELLEPGLMEPEVTNNHYHTTPEAVE